jgi:hypothetical protein
MSVFFVEYELFLERRKSRALKKVLLFGHFESIFLVDRPSFTGMIPFNQVVFQFQEQLEQPLGPAAAAGFHFRED